MNKGLKCKAGARHNRLALLASQGKLMQLRDGIKQPNFSASEFFKRTCNCAEHGTLFESAAEQGHLTIVEALLPYGKKYGIGYPLHRACRKNHTDCISFLIRKFPHHLDVVDNRMQYPIQIAAAYGNENVVKVLLEAGVEVDQRSSTEEVWEGLPGPFGHEHLEEYPQYFSPVYLAIMNNKSNAFMCLLQHGADITLSEDDIQEVDGRERLKANKTKLCPFSTAAYYGSYEILCLLIRHVTMTKEAGTRAVISAAINIKPKCLRLLFKSGALTFKAYPVPQPRDIWKKIVSCTTNEARQVIDTIELLLKNGMSMKPLVQMKSNALWEMIKDMQLPVLKCLFNHGLLEIRYLPFAGCEKVTLEESDYSSMIKCLTYFHKFRKLAFAIRTFPAQLIIVCRSNVTGRRPVRYMAYNRNRSDPHWSRANDIVIQDSPYRRVVTVSTLLRLCKWKVRSHLVKKNGFVSKDEIFQLQIPRSLQSYLWDL